jgi:hypothetical protein
MKLLKTKFRKNGLDYTLIGKASDPDHSPPELFDQLPPVVMIC